MRPARQARCTPSLSGADTASPPTRIAWRGNGGALTLDVECYVADRIALLANLRERCLWGGDTRKFHTQFGVGIKFIIN